MDIVSWTFAGGEYDRDKPLYIDSSDETLFLSSNACRKLVRQLIGGLHHYGLEEDDCVCVASFNNIYYTSIYLGIMGAGGCFSGANPGYTARELAHHVRVTNAKFILTEPKMLDNAVAAADECGISREKIILLNFKDDSVTSSKSESNFHHWADLLNKGEKDWVEITDISKPAAFVSTSGTSGLPKAAIIPHSYLVSQGEIQEILKSKTFETSNLIAIPSFHVFTLPVQHALPLRTGTPTYIMSRFCTENFLEALKKFQVTQTLTVPPILMALSKCSEVGLGSLRRIYVGGSCATDGMQQQLYSRLHKEATIVQVYGMTEVGWATAWVKTEIDTSGSVGQPVLGTTLRVVDREGNAVDKEGITGEIQIYNKSSMKGYLNNDIATSETITADGWVRTGDVGYVKEGDWYIIDRTKDLIKVRGWQVSPAEIEAALLEHPDVVDAGVIGVPAKDGTGESPLAYIVGSKDSKMDREAVRLFLGERLASYKNVDEVEFVEKIPRNPTGKILRRVLRDSRGTTVITPDQAAASRYSNALKQLEAYEKKRVSISEGSLSSKRSSSVLDIEKQVPVKESKKRKYCSISPCVYWRKLRSRSSKSSGSSKA